MRGIPVKPMPTCACAGCEICVYTLRSVRRPLVNCDASSASTGVPAGMAPGIAPPKISPVFVCSNSACAPLYLNASSDR